MQCYWLIQFTNKKLCILINLILNCIDITVLRRIDVTIKITFHRYMYKRFIFDLWNDVWAHALFKFVTSNKRDIFKALFYDKRKVKVALTHGLFNIYVYWILFHHHFQTMIFRSNSLCNSALAAKRSYTSCKFVNFLFFMLNNTCQFKWIAISGITLFSCIFCRSNHLNRNVYSLRWNFTL